jgi:hypothetical protein
VKTLNNQNSLIEKEERYMKRKTLNLIRFIILWISVGVFALTLYSFSWIKFVIMIILLLFYFNEKSLKKILSNFF